MLQLVTTINPSRYPQQRQGVPKGSEEMLPLLGFQQCIWPIQKDSATVSQPDLYGYTTQFLSSMEVG